MIQAKQSIDITTLAPFPDGRYLAAMRNTITWLAVNNRKIIVRVLIGKAPGPQSTIKEGNQPSKQMANLEFIKALVRDIPSEKKANITVYTGSMRSCGGAPNSLCLPKKTSIFDPYRFSWNHSKIINIDGITSIIGGHNWWTNTYLTAALLVM